MRALVAFLVFWASAFGSFGAASAAVSLSDELCTASSPADAPFSVIAAAPQNFDCSDSKYDFDGARIWVKIPFNAETLPAGSVEVQGDNNGLSTAEVHAVLSDGRVLSKPYSTREVLKSWRPKGSYGLIVPGSADAEIRKQIKTVYIAFDNPRIASSISVISLASTAKWDALKLPLLAMFGVLCGMIVMPLFYNVFFYGALRYSFMLWHSLMIAAAVVYTFSSSGLIFLAFPETSLTTKMLLNYWALAIAIAASGFFLVRFVESGKIAKWLQTVIFITAPFPVVVTALVLGLSDGYNMDARNYYHASFLPYIAVSLYTMVHAARRGSRAIWFQIAAWTPIIILALDRVARGMDLYIGIPALDYGLYFTLVFENLVLAFGVANRILHLRQHHENSLRKQVELALLADTDGLTAIANRRAFENEFIRGKEQRKYGHLAILDIDFFKQVNDVYGHEIGDEVLRVVGRELADTDNFVARIGGEEFALLMPPARRDNRKGSAMAELAIICDNLIRAIHQSVPEIKKPVTFSVGVADIPKRTPLKDVMSLADKRLYDAKNNGRNQIVSFDLSDLPKAPRETGAAPT